MATKLPDGQDFKGTVTAVSSLTLNVINAQHYASNLLPARMLFKGLVLTFIDEHTQNLPADGEKHPEPELESFANVLVADFQKYLEKNQPVSLRQWITTRCTKSPSRTQLRHLANALIAGVLQDDEAARFGMMAVIDSLCPYVTNEFGVDAAADAMATALGSTAAILQAAA